jgi:hypothetical protein
MPINIKNPMVLDSGYEENGTAFVTLCGVDTTKTITLVDYDVSFSAPTDDVKFLQEIDGKTSMPDRNDAKKFFCGLDRSILIAHPESDLSDEEVEKAKTILNIATEKVCEHRRF